MADQNNSIDTAQQALAPREALESQEIISFLQSGRTNERVMAYADRLKPYTTTPEGCQALINAFYYVAENDSHCKNNPPWNNGWYVGRMAAAAMGVTMSFLASSAHSAEKSPSNKIYQAGESLGPETQSKQIHEVLPPNQRFSILINNRLGQVSRGRHNIIWNEQENTYFFESYPAIGRVKIMPDDQILSYQEGLKEKLLDYPFSQSVNTQPIIERFSETPSGYERIGVTSEYQEWIRNLPLKPEGADVHTYEGEKTTLKESFFMRNAAVLDMNVLGKWQQCADSIMRLKAEYHWSRGEFDKIAFKNGNATISYNHWLKNRHRKHSRKSFEVFLNHIFANLGTASMKRDLQKVNPENLQVGDMNIQNNSGGVGHIFLILDIVQNPSGEKLFLLGQGATPAQDFHVVQPLYSISPWLSMDTLQKVMKKFSPYGDGVFRRF